MTAQAVLHKNAHDHSLKKLTALLQEDLEKVNHLILLKTHSSVELISTLAQHLIAAGGKRIRPVLTLACAKLFSYEGSHHINLATAVEFIHTATLLHDDVVDNSDLRRGQKTANTLWGNEASVLVGDFLFSQAFKLMVETKSLEALDALASASAIIAQGEVKQLLATCNLKTTLETYIEIIDAKTAELFKTACEIGPIVSKQSKKIRQALGGYGKNLGLMFQITDDILDYFGSTHTMGKSIGNDFREGKVTLPLILVYQAASFNERETLEEWFRDERKSDSHFRDLLDLMRQKNIHQKCQEIAKNYGKYAKNLLQEIPQTPLSILLRDLIDYCYLRIC